MASDWTPIFEYCSDKNRVVMPHPQERLALLAIRTNYGGEYLPYEVGEEYAKAHGVEQVRQMDANYNGTQFQIRHMETFVEETRAGSLNKEGEGYVIQFTHGDKRGHMVKIKLMLMWHCIAPRRK